MICRTLRVKRPGSPQIDFTWKAMSIYDTGTLRVDYYDKDGYYLAHKSGERAGVPFEEIDPKMIDKATALGFDARFIN